jgi:hypothetical protein
MFLLLSFEWSRSSIVFFMGDEKWRQVKLAREFLLASPFRRGTVATMTTMACQVSMRMMIMISNASNHRHAVCSIFLFYDFSPIFKGDLRCTCEPQSGNQVVSKDMANKI